MPPLSPSENLLHIKANCTGCGRCVAACHFGSLSLEAELPNGFGRKRATVSAVRCTGCRDCFPACLYQALGFAG